MKALFDTNVILDVLLQRQPFAPDALALFVAVETGELKGVLGATTVTTVYYLVAKAVGREKAITSIRQLLTIFEVAAVTRAVIERALTQPFTDFEDAVLAEAGQLGAVDVIVTRNVADFRHTSLPVYTPAELLAALLSMKRGNEIID